MHLKNAKKSLTQYVEDDRVTIKRPHTRNESIKVYNDNLHKSKLKTNPVEETSNEFTLIKLDNKTLEDFDVISKVFSKHFFMRNLSEANKKEVIREMFLGKIKANMTIVKQGSIGVFFYIIKEGEVNVIIEGKIIQTLKENDSFGELALLHNSCRTSTIISKTDCLCWCIDRRKFRKIIDHINNKNFSESRKFIISIPILSNLPNDIISILCSNLLKVYYDPGDYIIREGDTSKCMYIIKDGEVEVKKNNLLVRTLKKNDHFGDHSILLNSTRIMNVISKTKSIIYCITRETLIRMLGNSYLELLILSLVKNCFSRSKYFTSFNLNLLDNIFSFFEIKKYSDQSIVINSGDFINKKIIVILEGDLIDSKTKHVIAQRGEILFEEHLIKFSNKKCSIKVTNDILSNHDCLLCEADTELFLNTLGMENFTEILCRFNSIALLNDIPYFSRFNDTVKNEIIKKSIFEKYEMNDIIVKQGQVDSTFYIVVKGSVTGYKDNNIVNSKHFERYFNDCCLFLDQRVNFTIKCNMNTEILKIPSEVILSYISQPLLKYFKECYLYRINNPKIDDLIFIRDLGNSSIGTVCLVKCKFSHLYYAGKSISKLRIIEEKLIDILHRESNLSLRLEHPFITKVIKTFQTKHHVVFLKEFVNGCELFVAMNEIGIFNKYVSQFYFCSILLAIDYMHKNSILYRDIKPENVIISENVSYLIHIYILGIYKTY